jgi:hypothetical protein
MLNRKLHKNRSVYYEIIEFLLVYFIGINQPAFLFLIFRFKQVIPVEWNRYKPNNYCSILLVCGRIYRV